MVDRSIVTRAVNAGISSYADSRRRLITPFVDRHFSFKGAWELNRLALGRDLFRAPANLLWVPVYFVAKVGGAACTKAGLTTIADKVARLPPGIRTDVE